MSIFNGISVNVYDQNLNLLGAVENVIAARATRPLDRIGRGSYTMPVPSAGAGYALRDHIAHVYTYNNLLAANQTIAIFVIKSVRRVIPQNGQAAFEVSGPDLLHELTYRSIGENVIATSVYGNLAASAYGKATTLTVQANAGHTSITVDSAAGWVVGDLVDVKLNSGSWHTTTITSVAGSVIGLSAAIPVGGTANIDNVARTRILKFALADATGFLVGAMATVGLYPANHNYDTTVTSISGTTIGLADPIPEGRTSAVGNPVAFPAGFSTLTNAADEGDTSISIADPPTGLSVGHPITIGLDAATMTHRGVITAVAGNVITLSEPLPWGRAAPYPYVVRSKRPAANDIEQIMAFAPATWTPVIPGDGTPNGSYIVGAGETVYQALEQARQQGGGHFRLAYTGGIARELQWRTSRDSSGITLVMPDVATHADMTATNRGIILDFQEDFSDQQQERITRMYVAGANHLKITAAEPYVSPAAGVTVNWAASLITHTSAESGGAARIERHVTFENIRPEDDTDAAALLAAISLYKTAEARLLALQTQPKYYTVTCVTHSAVGIKPYNSIVVNYTGPGVVLSNATLTVLSVDYFMGQDGVLYTRLQLTDLADPPAQQLSDADYVAQTINRMDTTMRHLSSASAVSGSGGTAVPVMQHHDLLGLMDDDHPAYLREDGARPLTGNLAVSSGVTIDGVDISAHAANPSAHHAPVTAGDGIAVSGQQVVVDLASPSGLEFSGGDLRLADSVAGNGLSIASKIMAINLASPSGLEIASDALRINDTVAGAGLTISSKILAVGAGNGITVNADDVALTTPGTLSVSSTNNPAGNHTHAVTASDNPGAATQLLKSSAAGHLQLIRLGLQVAPAVPLHVAGATEQLRIEYDGSNYASFTEQASGTLQIETPSNINLYPGGDVILNPGGKDVLPLNNYDLNLGLINKKYLTLHCAELWVENLVTQNTIATIGGRILVTNTTELTRDLSAAETFMFVKHNQWRKNDTGYMESVGQVEFLRPVGPPLVEANTGTGWFEITDDWASFFVVGQAIRIGGGGNDGEYAVTAVSYNGGTNRTRISVSPGPATTNITGSTIVWAQQAAEEFCYLLVTRNLDGTGANTWYAGAAVVNTGQAGNGFIDLYSMTGVRSGFGPTIVGNVRNSQTYNDWTEHWAIGNLNGLYGYGLDTFGVGLGKYDTTTAYLTADATNGIRMMRGSTQLARWFANGDILVGQAAASQNNVLISAGDIHIRNNTTNRISMLASGEFTIRNSSGNPIMTFSTDGEFTLPMTLGTNGGIWQGTGTFASPTTGLKIWRDGSVGRLATYNSGTVQVQLDTAGKLLAGGGNVQMDSSGISLILDATENPQNAIKGMDGANIATWIGSLTTSSLRKLDHIVNVASGKDAQINMVAVGGPGREALWRATVGNTTLSHLYLQTGGSSPYLHTYTAASNPIKFGINFATAPSAILDIQQDTNDDPMIYLRSSGDVAHGMTAICPTDVYGIISKNNAANGGLAIQAFADTGSTSMVQFGTAVTADTAKSTSAVSPFIIASYLKNGTSRDMMSSNGNILAVRSGANTKFIVDAEGDIHYDGTANTYDDHDDVAMLRAINLAINPAGLIRDEFDRFVAVNREMLAAAGLVTFNDDGDGRHFVNMSGIQRLLMGAVWQMHKRVTDLEMERNLLKGV